MTKKLKVVLLCHYWSIEAEQIVGKKYSFNELSPWIQERLKMFENKEDIELHVISPNYTSNRLVEVEVNGIHYHFYKYAPSLLSLLLIPAVKIILKHDEPKKIADRSANTLTGFRTVVNSVNYIVNRIQPDVIHVFGTEFLDSSAGAVSLIGKYPILITIQGFAYKIKKSKLYLDNKFQDQRKNVEKLLNTSCHYMTFDSTTPDLPDFKPFERGQIKYEDGGNITRVPKINAETVNKKYDISFFGRVSADKGVEDLVKAIGLLTQKGHKLRTLIIGKCTPAYETKLEETLAKYTNEKLLHFSGFVTDHEEMYNLAASSTMVVLPTKVDLMPNTIRESIAMGLPVVASDAGYIPTLNKDQESVSIHHVGDVEDIALKIEHVYNDAHYRKMLIDNGRKTFKEQYSMDRVYSRTIEIYKAVYEESARTGVK